ncbi:DVUA0089 family protein [Ornithinimicrobium pekingense]|uniref:Peptidase C-terminal archaeal/bacterial domain-containing protein n=1 Tax=Ornithinimicrobium pekingense TaxID=384677 RepID=A0ABQ2FD88_9MICO|nr:DVUA0089 family protein [Ornithinimicrobium pekingense]GGK82177.1 hypothetical protein GCM10011509_33370 [Ornithinimicrobium pekingense]
MRTSYLVALSVSGVLAASALPPAVAAPAGTPEDGAPAPTEATAEKVASKVQRPQGPNPYLALLPDGGQTADYGAWTAYMAAQAHVRSLQRQSTVTTFEAQQQGRQPRGPLVYQELEAEGVRGGNDTLATAERVRGLGTDRRESAAAQVLGWLASTEGEVAVLPPNAEDDGSIPLARDTGVGETVSAVTTTGTVGDGPHGSAGTGTGDLDAYAVSGLAGQVLTVDIVTPEGDLDPMLLLFDAEGQLVGFNDDTAEGLDSRLTLGVPADGTYYAFVAGFPTFPLDPFDSASGDGAGSEGPYELSITQVEQDTDVFAVDLEEGDVLGLSVSGSATVLDVLEPDGTLVHGSEQDASFIYPLASPLPGGGNAVNDHVADVDGRHYVAVRGTGGAYDLTAEVYRPGLEGQRREQTLFLDFDGARVNTAIWGGPGVRQLSPLTSFLDDWGLSQADYKPLVREIVATVRENLERDLRRSGLDEDVEIRIRNSLQHRDPFGQDNVSRVVVGGTIAESGVDTIGIAQSIDPGNFDQEETALVLLDVLSSDPDVFGDASLNFYLAPQSDRVGFVGQAIGNVTSHEAGHFFGDWHVDQFNDVLNLMDQGGNFPLLYGAGPDGVGGTADDPDVDFGEDVFVPNEGFRGVQDTLTRVAAVLPD